MTRWLPPTPLRIQLHDTWKKTAAWQPLTISTMLLLSLVCTSTQTFAQDNKTSAETTTPKTGETTKDAKTSDKTTDEKKAEDKGEKKKDDKKEGDKKDGEKKEENNGQTSPTTNPPANNTTTNPQPNNKTGDQTPPATNNGTKTTTPPPKTTKTEPKTTKPPAKEEKPSNNDSPIADLADNSDSDFVPLQDIEEEKLDPIFPATVYPYLEWHGAFRFRSVFANTMDLGTEGTSAILPPLESYTPLNNPADPAAATLWGSAMRLRLEPTFHALEGLKMHLEMDFLDNIVLGSTPLNSLNQSSLRPDPSRNQLASNQFNPREREWFSNPLKINEAYGELDSFFGLLRVGRMDNHWGMGMFYNDGDCADCNYGDSIDRIYLRTQAFGIYGAFSLDFPNEGLTSIQANAPQGELYDLGQKDDVSQLTFSLLRKPQTKSEKEVQLKTLKEDKKPVFNGGLLFSWRTQEGEYLDARLNDGLPSTVSNQLIWRGMEMYIFDAWGQFLYEPSTNTRMRVELEVMAALGNVDNAKYEAVGAGNTEEGGTNVNCFNESERNANASVCNANSKDFLQLGVALESEFYLGGPISFGANAGFASGGKAPNWGYGATDGSDLDFFRFDPDYQIDLILFRNVIGSVTNAYYFNPYLQASFLESGDRKLRFDLDAIISLAADQDGTPAGNDPWLGVEIDGAFRYLVKDSLNVSLEGGLLFPLGGLNAIQDRPRLTTFGNKTNTFAEDVEATTAWTIQLNANWAF